MVRDHKGVEAEALTFNVQEFEHSVQKHFIIFNKFFMKSVKMEVEKHEKQELDYS